MRPTAGAAVLAAFSTIALSPVAQATPSTGVTGNILARTTIGDHDYILREITIEPGGTTGWHFHDGTLYAAVRSGTLSHYDASCEPDGIREPGAVFVEPGGRGYVHVGRNLGTQPLVLEVLYVLPVGSPLSEDIANPGCGFE